MATTPLLYAQQYISTTLNVGGGITNAQTTGIYVQSVAGIDISKPGVVCFSYAEPLDTSKAEYISYTSIDGTNQLLGALRAQEGYSAKAHVNGVAAAFVVSKSHINNLNDMFDTLGLDIKQLSTPTTPSSGRNKLYFKSDGELYKLNSSGTESQVGSVVTGLTVQNVTQTNLGASFNAASGTAEQEVTGLRVTLPIISGGSSCKLKIILKIFIGTVAGDNTIRVRVGTSTSYLTNTERDNLYVSGAKTLETFTGIVVVSSIDLTVQNYVVVSIQNGTNATGLNISASNARSTIITEVFK